MNVWGIFSRCFGGGAKSIYFFFNNILLQDKRKFWAKYWLIFIWLMNAFNQTLKNLWKAELSERILISSSFSTFVKTWQQANQTLGNIIIRSCRVDFYSTHNHSLPTASHRAVPYLIIKTTLSSRMILLDSIDKS